ncbi:MAG TPA: hypothetical protein VEY32_13500 [Flavisolibacter sp.]|nr:hypothetical protein [Flavisolibacter sp.]
MFKPIDLRIGNILKFRMLSESDNRFYKIQKSIVYEKDAQLVIDGFHMGMFEPVLLTEDIIKKIRGTVVIADKNPQKKVFKYKQFAFQLSPSGVQVQVVSMPLTTCHTLHELQNIYTSFSGEDLAINL